MKIEDAHTCLPGCVPGSPEAMLIAGGALFGGNTNAAAAFIQQCVVAEYERELHQAEDRMTWGAMGPGLSVLKDNLCRAKESQEFAMKTRLGQRYSMLIEGALLGAERAWTHARNRLLNAQQRQAADARRDADELLKHAISLDHAALAASSAQNPFSRAAA